MLDGVAAGVPQRGITTILGPNGAGKSMLLRAIHGLIPHDGRIDWADRPAPKQALVFQKPVLLRRSVAANMDFVLGRDRARRDALLAEMGLLGHAKQPARRLSGASSSAWPSPARWPRIPNCCFWTSRQPALIPHPRQ